MTFREVMLSIEGLREKDLMNMHLLRRATFIIASTGMNGGKVAARMNKLWPVEMETKSNVSERARATLRKFQEIDAKNRANGRRTQDSNRG